MEEFKTIAQRMVNAENAFISCIMGLHNVSRCDAEKVLAVYRKLKVVKSDAVVGRINVVHGAYLDLDAVRNAINYKL